MFIIILLRVTITDQFKMYLPLDIILQISNESTEEVNSKAKRKKDTTDVETEGVDDGESVPTPTEVRDGIFISLTFN